MLSQSQIAYDLAAERAGQLAEATAKMNARQLARGTSRSGKLRMLLGEALITTGRRVQGQKSCAVSPLLTAGSES